MNEYGTLKNALRFYKGRLEVNKAEKPECYSIDNEMEIVNELLDLLDYNRIALINEEPKIEEINEYVSNHQCKSVLDYMRNISITLDEDDVDYLTTDKIAYNLNQIANLLGLEFHRSYTNE